MTSARPGFQSSNSERHLPLPGGIQRYSRWDGSQRPEALDPDEVMRRLAEEIMAHGDLESALGKLLREGIAGPVSMPGLREMLRSLRERRRRMLERYDLGSVMNALEAALEEVLALERQTLDEMDGASPRTDTPEADGKGATDEGGGGPPDRSPGNGRDPAQAPDEPSFARNLMGDIAERNRQFLDGLPDDAPGKVKALEGYEFTSPAAQKKFEALLDQLRQAMTRTFFRDVERMIQEMSDGDIERLKRMIAELNDLLLEHIGGGETDFEGFMKRYGDLFGPNPPRTIDRLVEQMQSQIAAAQSLLMSMPGEHYETLQKLLQDRLGDEELERSLRSLAQKLDFLDSNQGQRYRFRGNENIDLDTALDVMDEMHALETLEGELGGAARDGDIEHVDPDRLEALLGEEARRALERMREMVAKLEQAGYLGRNNDALELTPRGMRQIGRSALGEIYRALKRRGLGNHLVPGEGRFGEQLDATKRYEFGDPFNLHLSRTVQNAIRRQGLGTPVSLDHDDFEVYRHEQSTRTATVLLVDLSWSMELRGAFPAAKKVTLALHDLISSAYPRDRLHVVGFSAYAREIAPHEVAFLGTDEYVLGTNMHHALLLAERLLDRDRNATRQVLMITDGEPTAHIERGRARFAYPPTRQTIRETLRAVQRCTRKRITINTFMLDESHYLRSFMNRVSRLNGGRVFFSSPEHLGEFVLVDYVRNRRAVLGNGR